MRCTKNLVRVAFSVLVHLVTVDSARRCEKSAEGITSPATQLPVTGLDRSFPNKAVGTTALLDSIRLRLSWRVLHQTDRFVIVVQGSLVDVGDVLEILPETRDPTGVIIDHNPCHSTVLALQRDMLDVLCGEVEQPVTEFVRDELPGDPSQDRWSLHHLPLHLSLIQLIDLDMTVQFRRVMDLADDQPTGCLPVTDSVESQVD